MYTAGTEQLIHEKALHEIRKDFTEYVIMKAVQLEIRKREIEAFLRVNPNIEVETKLLDELEMELIEVKSKLDYYQSSFIDSL